MAGSGADETVIAHWREAREWWLGEPAREFRTIIDANGVRRLQERPLSNFVDLGTGQKPLDENHNEDWSLRERKIRDEKVSAAVGALPQSYYDRQEKERQWSESRVREMARETTWAADVEMAPYVAKSVPKRARSQTAEQEYVPLHVVSGYSFGRSTILATEIAAIAAHGECPAAVIADSHSLSGAVEHDKACKLLGIKPLIGASIELSEGGEIVLIAQTKRGYQNLSRLISECHLGEPRSFPLGSWERLGRFAADLICLTGGDLGPVDRLLVQRDPEGAKKLAERLAAIYGRANVFIEIERSFLPWSMFVGRQLLELSDTLGIKAVAGGAVTHSREFDFPAQDALVSAHTLCLIEEVLGRKEVRDPSQPQIKRYPERALNAERYLHTCRKMKALFADRLDLLENTLRLAEKCEDDVLPRRTQLPQLFEEDSHALRAIVDSQAYAVYPDVTQEHRKRLKEELDRITKLGYATHFLVAWDFCRWAREQDIQMSGRGSVVDSAVAFVLGLSRIDAIRHNLHFNRFLPEDGSKRPDLDIDFEAKKRDDVRGYVAKKYGIERVAAVAAIGAYGTRGIVREVGKVFGLPNETISFLAKRIHGGVQADRLEAALEGRPELRDSGIPAERFRWVFRLAARMMDVPRNIRTHSSGVVISDRPICETVPVMWSASPTSQESGADESQLRMIQWDKRSAKHFFDKFDILCLRGQDVMSGVEKRIRAGDPDFSAEQVQATEDPEVYRAMRSGELIGIPQSASPAMRQAHMRLRTENLHDTSLVQAGIRPGVGGAVKLNELIARRRGKSFEYGHDDFREIFKDTYGIIVFQEQVDQLLQKFCGYTGGQAEDIRDTIHKRRRDDYGETIRRKLIESVLKNGYSLSVAEQVYNYVAGFKGYGFAQGHALAFAEVSLRSVWMMQNHPAEYFAALLSAQPAGYYGPCTIANEARSRGAKILPLDVNRSQERFEVESITSSGEVPLVVPNAGIRVGLMQLVGLSKPTKQRILECQSFAGEFEPEYEPQPLASVPTSEGALIVASGSSDRKRRGGGGGRSPRTLAFGSFFDFAAKVQPSRDELEAFVLSGAFDSMHPNRRALMWAIPDAQDYAKTVRTLLGSGALPLDIPEPPLNEEIEDFSTEEKAIHERAYLGMDIEKHLMAFERARVSAKGGVDTATARQLPHGTKAFAVGNPIRLRFPPTSSGKRVVFFDLEDETGLLNVTCFDDVYQRYGKAIICSQYATVVGMVQDRDGSPAFLAHHVFQYHPTITASRSTSIYDLPIGVADFLVG